MVRLKSITISEENKDWFLSLRIYERETADDIMTRIKTKYIGQQMIIA